MKEREQMSVDILAEAMFFPGKAQCRTKTLQCLNRWPSQKYRFSESFFFFPPSTFLKRSGMPSEVMCKRNMKYSFSRRFGTHTHTHTHTHTPLPQSHSAQDSVCLSLFSHLGTGPNYGENEAYSHLILPYRIYKWTQNPHKQNECLLNTTPCSFSPVSILVSVDHLIAQ